MEAETREGRQVLVLAALQVPWWEGGFQEDLRCSSHETFDLDPCILGLVPNNLSGSTPGHLSSQRLKYGRK